MSGAGFEAGAILRDILLKEYAQGALSATLLCVLAFWITQAGAIGVEDLKRKPDDSTGNYQKHLDKSLGLSDVEKQFYNLRIPSWDHDRDERSDCDVCYSLLPQRIQPLLTTT